MSIPDRRIGSLLDSVCRAPVWKSPGMEARLVQVSPDRHDDGLALSHRTEIIPPWVVTRSFADPFHKPAQLAPSLVDCRIPTGDAAHLAWRKPCRAQGQPATGRITCPSRPSASFNVDASNTRLLEVQLYMSEDQGQNWQKVASAAPEQGGFHFRPSAMDCTFSRSGPSTSAAKPIRRQSRAWRHRFAYT